MNEKKILIFAFLIICLSFICQEINLTGHSIYYQGESFESDGKSVTIKKISSSNAVFDVDGEKNIISVGEYKEINGIKIEVISIFYVDEPEERNVDISASVITFDAGNICGDNECEENENSDNCCVDCGCSEGYECDEDECILIRLDECKDHEDCDDGDFETTDLCLNQRPRVCKNYRVDGDQEEESIEEQVEDEEEETSTPEIKKEGFFTKLINFLKSLF